VVVVGGPSRRPTNPRWRTAAILKKTVKSPYLWNRLTDFDEIWYNDAYWTLTADLSLKFPIFEKQRWRRPPSWKITKIATSPQRFDQSLRNLVHWCKMAPLTAPTVKKFDYQKSKMADGRHFKNRKIAISLQPCDRFWWNLAQWHILVPYKGSFVKITNFWNPTWRRPTFENHKNRDISATVWPIFTKFGTLMQHGFLNLSDR